MDALSLLHRYFTTPRAADVVIAHSRHVAAKALTIAANLNDSSLDLAFIEEAALLHDIGVCRTRLPDMGCSGSEPYIRHGILGRIILEEEKLPRHALVCERHIGVGLTAADIINQQLPLPLRDMVPLTSEERIVAFADLFFSKKPDCMHQEKTFAQIRATLETFGAAKIYTFDRWVEEFCQR